MSAVMTDFVEEMTWRGLIHDIMPGTKEQLNKEITTAYVGFDPTADSLHVGSLVPIMMLVHFQRCGHKPIALVGGATAMVGDPSGKSAERNLLTIEQVSHNADGIKKQLGKFLDFGDGKQQALMVNNYDWFGQMSFLEFIRDIGKHLTVNYMMAKDSVTSRMESGISFTEFSYQLVQGYDFYWLYKNKNCLLQMGGSDQWGNVTTGTEFIRRMDQGKAFAMTCPLMTKADGSKFGKTEQGNVWLDPERTSPYKFFQFWRNSRDEDVDRYLKTFTEKTKEEIDALVKEGLDSPGANIPQTALAEDVTRRVHGDEALQKAIEASRLLFKTTKEELFNLSTTEFKEVFEDVDSSSISRASIESGVNILDLMAETGIFKSKGEARRMIQQGGLKINSEKCVSIEQSLGPDDLINNGYMLIQLGKRKKFILYVE